MTESETLQLIFKSGFSTASQVSDISGRGVGMDIVRSHIEKLSGTIDIETKKGLGTKMIIKLPLTLAIMKGLLVELNKRIYSLPTNSVIEIVRIHERDIQFVNGKEFIQIRERILPLCWLHDHFNFPRVDVENKNIIVVIIGVAEKRFGLVVDELIGNQEIVIKSLGTYIGKIEGISGAAILGNGGIALILDTIGIVKLLHREREDEHET
jgi:two-component system chemotaxis sensor kinase CheA